MEDSKARRPLAVITGASSGIGYHLARCAADHGYDLLLAADMPLEPAVGDLQALGATVESLQCDLATEDGVRALLARIGPREVDALMANAGHGLGGRFIDQKLEDVLHVLNTNVTGTIHLIQQVARGMATPRAGRPTPRILVTGSIAGFQPGSFHAVYNATKAFIDSFTLALRNELKDAGITVTCLMPGPTDTEFFVRADMQDSQVANSAAMMMQPEDVARIGFEAMLEGEADVVAGWKNKAQVAMSKVMPAQATAALHRKLAQPQPHAGGEPDGNA